MDEVDRVSATFWTPAGTSAFLRLPANIRPNTKMTESHIRTTTLLMPSGPRRPLDQVADRREVDREDVITGVVDHGASVSGLQGRKGERARDVAALPGQQPELRRRGS